MYGLTPLGFIVAEAAGFLYFLSSPGFPCVWAVPGYMPFVLPTEETVLHSLLLVLVLVPFPSLTILFVVMLLLRPSVLIGLRCILPLLAAPWVLYVEDLLI